MRKVALWLTIPYLGAVLGINIAIDGPAGSAVRIAGLPVFFFWTLTKIQEHRFRKLSPFHWGFLCFVLMNLLSMFWSIDATNTYIQFWKYVFIIGMSIILWDLYRTEEEVRFGILGFLLGAYIIFSQTLMNFIQKKAYFGTDRFGADGLHPNVVALVLAVSAPIAWMFATNAKGRAKLLGPITYTFPLVALFGIAITGSRGGAVAALPGFLYILIDIIKRPIGIPLVAAAVFFGFPAIAAQPEIQNNFKRITETLDGTSKEAANGRDLLLQAGEEIFWRNPILGVGATGFRTASVQMGMYEQHETGVVAGAHNTYVEVASELGLVGLTIFLATVFFAIKSLWSLPKPYRTPWMCGAFSFIVLMTYEHIEWRYFLWAYMSVGVCHAYALMRKQAELKATSVPVPNTAVLSPSPSRPEERPGYGLGPRG
jgi:O-antigen ligase